MVRRKYKNLLTIIIPRHIHRTDEIIEKISPFTDVPILFVSALNKQRLLKALEVAIEVYKNRNNKIKNTRKLYSRNYDF